MLRKLEYLLFDAVNSQSDTVVTVGDIRSDHCRLTAAAAAKYGLRSIVISVGHYDGELSGNLLLSSLFGAGPSSRRTTAAPKRSSWKKRQRPSWNRKSPRAIACTSSPWAAATRRACWAITTAPPSWTSRLRNSTCRERRSTSP